MTRLIYLLEYPMNARDHERFGIDLMRDAGIDVEVWDFTPFLHPRLLSSGAVTERIAAPFIREFSSSREATKALRALPESTWLLLILAWTWKHVPIYRAITRRGLRFGFESTISIPTNQLSVTNKVQFLAENPRLLPQIVFNRLSRQQLGIAPATFVMAGGEASVSLSHPLVGDTTKVLRCHTLDYDRYRAARNGLRLHDAPYAVFIDQSWPFHPDFIREGVAHPVRAEEYYPLLCRLFAKVEKDLGLEVVVAAHPRSHYESMPDYFEGRRIVRGRTVDLIRDAELVIAHDTTALNFANLFRKPVLFATLDFAPRYRRFIFTEAFAEAFGKQAVHLDRIDEIDWDSERTVDDGAYDRYRRRYIKVDGTSDAPAWQQVAAFILAHESRIHARDQQHVAVLSR